MSVTVTGIREIDRAIGRTERALTKERKTHLRLAASKTLAPAVRRRALSVRGRAGARLARAVSARGGKGGSVLVGPTARGAWFRAMFIAGAKAHVIGGARSAETREYRSSSRQYRNTGGLFYRYIKARSRAFLYNPAGPFIATGPVRHPGFPDVPFVLQGTDDAMEAFREEIRKRLWMEPMSTSSASTGHARRPRA